MLLNNLQEARKPFPLSTVIPQDVQDVLVVETWHNWLQRQERERHFFSITMTSRYDMD